MPTPTSLRVVLGRASLWDDRTADLGAPFHLGNFVFDTPRLPIGALVVEWPAPATAVSARLSLFVYHWFVRVLICPTIIEYY
jgi:hypothetical protein